MNIGSSIAPKVVNYKAARTTGLFHKSGAFVRGILGCVGSGKSVACTMEIFIKAKQQARGVDGIRRSRWLIVRNTLPQLEMTTMKTWLEWFPEQYFGKMYKKPPYRHMLKFDDVECEVFFLALDKPEDQKKLLSFETTGIWFNEAREIPFEIIQAGTSRVGRYPSVKDKPEGVDIWPTWRGIIMDTNPPDDNHWWYKCDVEDMWAMDQEGEPVDPKSIDIDYAWEFWRQPSGLSDEAENIANLRGGKGYYLQQLGGKTKEWININVHGEYGFVEHGMPVYGKSWDGERMIKENIKVNPHGKIYIGVDASGRHPAAIFVQKTSRGQIQVIAEISVQEDEGMGAVAFSRLLRAEIVSTYKDNIIEAVWGDPAGDWKSQNDEQTYFDILRANGVNIRSSPGRLLPDRLETVKAVMESNIDRDPKLIIDKSCTILVRGMNGGYKYKKLNISGTDAKYDPKPDKNRFSDVQDSLQYLLCGIGEMRAMKSRLGNGNERKTYTANTDFSVY